MIQVTPQLIEKYHLGQCTAAERAAVDGWLESEAMEEVPPSTLPGGVEEEERMWQALAGRMTGTLGAPDVAVVPARKNSNIRKAAVLAVSLAAAACIAIVSYIQRVKPEVEAIALTTLDVPYGRKAQLTLADGTTVYLNGGSRLRYPEQFTGSQRTVSLSGEAFFDVARDTAKSFVIETRYTRTAVLGTAFNLSAYDEEATTLAVQRGKVRFGSGDGRHTAIFTAGQGAVLLDSEGLSRLEKVAPERFGWKENRLVFNNHSLASIVIRLQRWYDVEIRVTDPALAQRTFTGTFDNPSLSSLMQHLAFVMQFDYAIKDSHITIY